MLSKFPVSWFHLFATIEDGRLEVILPLAPIKARGSEGKKNPVSPHGATVNRPVKLVKFE